METLGPARARGMVIYRVVPHQAVQFGAPKTAEMRAKWKRAPRPRESAM